MSSKYKSPLIRSRNTSAITDNQSPNLNAESPPTRVDKNLTDNQIVYDNTPQPASPSWRGRGCSSPRFNTPQSRGRASPYQWTPNRFNNSWSSDVTNKTTINIVYCCNC